MYLFIDNYYCHTDHNFVRSHTSGKRCYVPVVEDKCSNMKLLHLGEAKSLLLYVSSSSSIFTIVNYFATNWRQSNVCSDEMSALKPMPPYGILEPSRQYEDGSAREDGGQ